MATLEVHDGEGRVQFVDLARDHPLLFGSSAACDIMLPGAGIMPVHGRIRWKKGNYRVEASPDAEYVVVNGHKMTSSSLHQGDEMVVGDCRLFLFRVEEQDQPQSRKRPARRVDEERTRVVEGPLHFAPPARDARERGEGQPTTARASAPPAPLERNDWLADLEADRGAAENVAASAASPVLDRGPDGKARGREQAGPQAPPRFAWIRQWYRELRDERAAAPGRERIVSSPLVLGLALAFGLLVLLGFGLKSIITKTLADQRYNQAVQDVDDGDYRTAIRDFDNFLAAHPQDKRVGKARVLRALANVRQYISISGGTWSTALKAAHEMVEQVSNLPEYRDERPELAELLIRIGEGLADRSRRSADEKALKEAESVVPFHAEIAGEPAESFLKRSRLPGLLDEARAAVRKSQVRAAALASMDLGLQKGSAALVYKARDQLLDQYADLAQDRDLLQRMTQANDLIRKAVKVDRTHKAAATTERPEVLGPPTSLVLRSSLTPRAAKLTPEAFVYGLADGLAYCLDGVTGSPVWQRPVGLASPFPPRAVPGDPTVLVADARHNELLRLEAATGKLLWRHELGELVEGPPLIQGDRLFQVLPSGKLMVIALSSGERQATVNLGLPLSRSPASDEQGRYLYLVGRRACLFVLARETLGCLVVEYLGHEDGSIPCSPVRIGRFLVIAENDRPSDSRWRVLVLDDEGAKVRQVQQVQVPGWTWSSPAASGSIIWATGDKGGVEAYALGDYASKAPLHPLAQLNPDAAASGLAFGLAVSERELWLSAGRSGKFSLDPERGQITSQLPLGQLGPALAPLQLASRHVVLTFQDPATGGISLLGVDKTTGTVAWQSVLGAPWPTPLAPTRGEAGLKSVGQTGAVARLSLKQVQSGGFVELPLPRPGDAHIPSGTLISLGGAGQGADVIAPRGESPVVWVREAGQSGGWRKLELPAPLAATPLAWGSDLLIPGGDGRAYLIDPVTARSRAEPLVPVFDRDRRGRWRAPVRLDAPGVILADDAGRVRRLSLRKEPVPRLAVEAETLLNQRIIADPAATGQAVIVATADQSVRALSARDLSPIGSWPLEAPLLSRPVAVGDRVFVFDGGGGVMALSRDGRKLWTIKLDAPVAGTPLIDGQLVWFLDRQGRLHARSLEGGAGRQRIDLGILPAGGMLAIGAQPIAPVARGTVAPLSLNSNNVSRP
ncbi:MAG: PQQ-binding-like beta-propeller repeat protein [Isosphaeraceae bacterium]